MFIIRALHGAVTLYILLQPLNNSNYYSDWLRILLNMENIDIEKNFENKINCQVTTNFSVLYLLVFICRSFFYLLKYRSLSGLPTPWSKENMKRGVLKLGNRCWLPPS